MSVFMFEATDATLLNAKLVEKPKKKRIKEYPSHINDGKTSYGGDTMATPDDSTKMIPTKKGNDIITFSDASSDKEDFHEFLARLLVKNEQYKASQC
ncbi:hypothetical protein D1B33_04760 [Lysinibacillus yapensis]|uniref:Uncharacterized protein n=1 Tax=Ureibacillus yapensis TaxID=2304605 RepID=A0A396SAT0_9BACL|nr:hypothetical protein [Lysinibacillus yapensis]RHW38203.1 hypothetical protein D1B33_04760 [Lysinibacillus yapensis]